MAISRNILLLQGPLGPFFADLSAALLAAGANVWRVNFNAGDRLYAGHAAEIDYHDTLGNWPEFLEKLIVKEAIDTVVLYGDMRAYHRAAKLVAEKLALQVWCLEEGYVRPGYITCEPGGNNANSLFPATFRDAQCKNTALPSKVPEAATIGPVIRSQIWFGISYYALKDTRFSGFEGYYHHRRGGAFLEQRAWIRAGFRKLYHKYIRDRGKTDQLIQRYSSKLVLVPLQVAVDTQIVYHSRFDHIEDFIAEIIESAAKHMPETDHLLIKHHPMDRGHTNYQQLIQKLARRYGMEGRISYLFDVDLDQLIPHCKSCITVNSTLSNTTLGAGVPTVTLGKCMVGDMGFSNTVLDEDFWQNPASIDSSAVRYFLDCLSAYALLPGSFYGKRHIAAAEIARKMMKNSPNCATFAGRKSL